MINTTKKLLIAAMASLVFAAVSAVNAAPPNPLAGYSSVQDNVLVSANFGRCNALGILAGMVCDAYEDATLIEPPISGFALANCFNIEVELYDSLSSCMSGLQRALYCENANDPSC